MFSSVLDIRYKRPEDFKASVTASLLGASAHIEGSNKRSEPMLTINLGICWRDTRQMHYILGSANITGDMAIDISAYTSLLEL
ncbi:MAG: hypothetical protein U0T36_03280 [Saprospiraceae bacterium]